MQKRTAYALCLELASKKQEAALLSLPKLPPRVIVLPKTANHTPGKNSRTTMATMLGTSGKTPGTNNFLGRYWMRTGTMVG